MRVSFVVLLSICTTFALKAGAADSAGMTPEALVQRGIASFRASHYADAATDLNAAAQALLSQEQMQNYVNTGKFPNLERLETALVYLTLAESKLGHNDQAREAVLRLMTAERIEPAYAQLPLESDAAEFEAIAAKLVPGTGLPANTQLARGGTPSITKPTGTIAEAAPTGPVNTTATAPAPPATTTTASSQPPVAAAMITPVAKPAAPPKPAPAVVAKTETAPAIAATRTTVAADEQECARIQKEADERIASEIARIQKEADARIATERAAIQRAADERIAQVQKSADAQVSAMQSQNRRSYLLSLRQADGYAASNKTAQANEVYDAILSAQDAPREMMAEAAVGLYRTSAFRRAADAFRKLAPFARGEEDLRYYNAVSLYETGDYAGAKHELACALPFIEVTSAVSRYRSKIEHTPSQQAIR